jgi:hypothetical protein
MPVFARRAGHVHATPAPAELRALRDRASEIVKFQRTVLDMRGKPSLAGDEARPARRRQSSGTPSTSRRGSWRSRRAACFRMTKERRRAWASRRLSAWFQCGAETGTGRLLKRVAIHQIRAARFRSLFHRMSLTRSRCPFSGDML